MRIVIRGNSKMKNNRSYITKGTIILLMIAMLHSLAACGNKTNVTYDNSIPKNQYLGNSIGNLMNHGRIAQDGNYVYFSVVEDDYYARLYRTDLDGKNKTMVLEYLTNNLDIGIEIDDFDFYTPSDPIRGINVIKNYIFYIGAENKIYRADKDGENIQKLSDIEMGRLFAYKDMLYIIGDYDNNNCKLYAMDFNGENERVLYDDYVGGISFYNDYIYFSHYSSLFKMDLNFNNKDKIFEHPLSNTSNIDAFHIYNDGIYYVSVFRLYKMDMAGKNATEIGDIDRTQGGVLNFYENHLFFLNHSSEFLGHIDLDTAEYNETALRYNASFYVINNKVFYKGVGGLYSMNFDGSYHKKFG